MIRSGAAFKEPRGHCTFSAIELTEMRQLPKLCGEEFLGFRGIVDTEAHKKIGAERNEISLGQRTETATFVILAGKVTVLPRESVNSWVSAAFSSGLGSSGFATAGPQAESRIARQRKTGRNVNSNFFINTLSFRLILCYNATCNWLQVALYTKLFLITSR